MVSGLLRWFHCLEVLYVVIMIVYTNTATVCAGYSTLYMLLSIFMTFLFFTGVVSVNVNMTVEMVVGVVAEADTGEIVIVTETMTGAAGGGAVADLPVTARMETGEEAAMTGLTATETAGEADHESAISAERTAKGEITRKMCVYYSCSIMKLIC